MSVEGDHMAEKSAVKARDLTDDEVASFKENGWVKLSSLISTEQAAELLQRAKARMGPEGDSQDARPGRDYKPQGFMDYDGIAEEDELFAELAFGKDLGRNAQRLIRALTSRDAAVRSYLNSVLVKLPSAKDASHGTGPTEWHQDTSAPMDRVGNLLFWIALDEVTPEMGSMRFYSGSHRIGRLGETSQWIKGRGLLDVYPRLKDEHPISPPLHYRPGDATVHAGQTVHGAPRNSTSRPRWAFTSAYFPADALYTGLRSPRTIGLGLEVSKPFEHPRFPIVMD
jgi:hypothetical protein